MQRPKCRRCGGPLDLWKDGVGEQWRWSCNNLDDKWTPMFTDEEFAVLWANLPGDDVVLLEKEMIDA
jgi:hypothetical protein